MDIYTIFAVTGLIITLVVCGIAVQKSKKGTVTGIPFLSKTGEFIDKHYLVFLLLIFAVFLISRLLKLDSFPNGLHVDELAVAVDAKSIYLNGTDRWGMRYPAYFYDYGNGQNALYVYGEAFLLNFLPSNIYTLRIQAVIWGALCFFAMFGICYEITKSKGWALAGPVLVTTLPVYVMSERWALEAYLFLPTAVITMYFLIRSINYGKVYDCILAGVFMGTSLYTYAVSYMAWPIFLVMLGVYLLYLKKLHIKQLISFGIPLGILAFPLMLYQLVNFRIIEPLYFLVSDYIPLPMSRGQEMSISNIIGNLAFFKNLFMGDTALPYNALPEFGTIYLFLVPFVVAGFIICIKDTVVSIRERTFSASAPLLFFWFGGTVFMLVVKGPNINRVNELFLPLLLFIFIAIYRLLTKDGLAIAWLSVWTGVSFVFFMYFYFFVQNDVYGFHLLHTDEIPAKALFRTESSYLKDENTHIYIQFEDHSDQQHEQIFYFAGKKGDVFDIDKGTYGNVTVGFPEEFDLNENAAYIIGNDWGHIISYLISEGFAADQTFPGYSILYRLN